MRIIKFKKIKHKNKLKDVFNYFEKVKTSMKINAQIVIAYHWRKRRRMFQKRLEEMAKQARRKNSNKKKIKKPRQSVKWNMRGPSHTIKLKKQSSNIKNKALKKRKSLNSNTDLDTVKED